MPDRSSDDLPLAAEFPAATYNQWRSLAQAALKGAHYEEVLQSRTADGLVIEPLYPGARRSSAVASRAPGLPWQVLQRIDHPDSAAAHAQALDDLDGGTDGLVLVGAGSIGAHDYGLIPAADRIEAVLDGVDLKTGLAIEFDLGPQSNALPRAFASLIGARGIAPDAVAVRFGLDPLGGAVLSGGFSSPSGLLDVDAQRLLDELAAAGFRRWLMVADGRIVHDAGGTEAQELAYVLTAGIAMLRALEARGIALEDARRMIFFRLAADSDQFLTIAKFRALRRCWQRVEASCGLAPEPVFISAETAWRTMTRNDPTVNIVRATIATFAAAVGGADAITVVPFTAAHGLPDAFARRIARNTQLVVRDEANLARVTDPTAGTGWSEDLTANLCGAAWTLLKEIETCGGARSALQKGVIQAKVSTARAERQRAVATRHLALIGANEFPDIGEAPVAVLEAAPVKLPAEVPAAPVEPLVPIRLAEPFEALRDASDRILTVTGRPPKIFLANIGEPADYTPRADFAKNFFGAGGIEAIPSPAAATIEQLVTAFRASETNLACLCAADEVYGRTGAEAAQAFMAAGAARLYVAGQPDALQKKELGAAGVQGFIYAGSDMLAILRDVHRLFA